MTDAGAATDVETADERWINDLYTSMDDDAEYFSVLRVIRIQTLARLAALRSENAALRTERNEARVLCTRRRCVEEAGEAAIVDALYEFTSDDADTLYARVAARAAVMDRFALLREQIERLENDLGVAATKADAAMRCGKTIL